MPIVILSSSSYDCRKELADDLAKKTGYPCLSREEVVEKANSSGIPVGKLEVAVLKAPVLKERLLRLKQLSMAYITATICEKAKDGNLIYHGRAGHLLFPQVSHVLRVRLIPDPDFCLKAVMGRLRMDREKALQYLQQVEEDVTRWVRIIHGVDPDDSTHYDMILNLNHINLYNASSVICSMMDLPDFQPTPASLRIMDDHRLAAQTRLRLALDERTASAELNVSASHGIVTVTYPPSQAHLQKIIPGVCDTVEGCREILCTVAETNILWIQEEFRPESDVFDQICSLAQRWGAAVELLRWKPTDTEEAIAEKVESKDMREDERDVPKEEPVPLMRKETGGIEDEGEEPASEMDDGLASTVEKLVSLGRYAGMNTLTGTRQQLLSSINREVNYSLVVVGDVYLSRPAEAQMRETRELRRSIQERLNLPTIETSELKSRFFFGKRQIAKFLVFLLLVLISYTLVFTNQEAILDFLGGTFHKNWRWLTPIGVGLFVPLIAHSYSTVTGLIMKLIHLD